MGTLNRDRENRVDVMHTLMNNIMENKESTIGDRCWEVYLDPNMPSWNYEGFTPQKNYKCTCCFTSKDRWTPLAHSDPTRRYIGLTKSFVK